MFYEINVTVYFVDSGFCGRVHNINLPQNSTKRVYGC